MRRAARLFQIVQLIRGLRLSTATYLAERLAVTPRTIYRDVADLQHQGVGRCCAGGANWAGRRFGPSGGSCPWQNPVRVAYGFQSGCRKPGGVCTAQCVNRAGRGHPPALTRLARRYASTAQSKHHVSRLAKQNQSAHPEATGLLLLGQSLDTGSLV